MTVPTERGSIGSQSPHAIGSYGLARLASKRAPYPVWPPLAAPTATRRSPAARSAMRGYQMSADPAGERRDVSWGHGRQPPGGGCRAPQPADGRPVDGTPIRPLRPRPGASRRPHGGGADRRARRVRVSRQLVPRAADPQLFRAAGRRVPARPHLPHRGAVLAQRADPEGRRLVRGLPAAAGRDADAVRGGLRHRVPAADRELPLRRRGRRAGLAGLRPSSG